MVGGLPEGVGAAGWRGAKGGNQDYCNSIINKIEFKKKRIYCLGKALTNI